MRIEKLNSLTIFFPFLNDEGTVKKAIDDAYFYGRKFANKLEVIAIHGGKSKDNTLNEILKQKTKYHNLIVIDKTHNMQGYAVIKHGFKKASKQWVFYTDGDLQYDIKDLEKLIKAHYRSHVDVVNGYKLKRRDNISRIILGYPYQIISKYLYKLPIKDLTCDFRLIRKSKLNKISLNAKNASILLELIMKLQYVKSKFIDVPINHKKRKYGKSNYNIFNLFIERTIKELQTYMFLRKRLYNKNHENN